MQRAYENELLKGKEEGKFCPNDNMTYAEAITLGTRMHANFNWATSPDEMTADGPWYQKYVNYATENGIPCDYPDMNAKITREDFVHIFYACVPTSEPINNVPDGSIGDVPMTNEHAAEIYEFYRTGVLAGSDSAHNFKPNDNIKRSEVAAIACRLLMDYDLVQFDMQ